jgi:calcium/calmodulin-dependent protein kinase kinase 2
MSTAPVSPTPGIVHTSSVRTSVNDAGEQVVNQYRITSLLGTGAYAKVYLASTTDPKTRKTSKYALKIFSKSVLRKQKDIKVVGRKMVVTTALQKVQREIAIMKKIKHPNIVRLHEVGVMLCVLECAHLHFCSCIFLYCCPCDVCV